MDTKNPYYEYVESFSSMIQKGMNLPLGEIAAPPDYVVNPQAPKVAILSPHPDDECVMGPLALRLKRETGSEIVNIPITFGSNHTRREERKEELSKACKWIGFEIHNLRWKGLRVTSPLWCERAVTKSPTSSSELSTIRLGCLICPQNSVSIRVIVTGSI